MSYTPEVTINSVDVFKEYGVVFGAAFTDVLLSPPSTKPPIQSESRLEHGTRTIIPKGGMKVSRREFSVEIGITAPNRETFLKRYDGFMEFLTSGWLNIKTEHIPGKTFKCLYVNCTQFTSYNTRIAKYILKLEESNPNNRS